MVQIKHEERVRGHDNFVLVLQCQQVYHMMYPCPKLSAWWVVYKVNPREPLPIPSDSCYHACNLEDKENYGIVQEDDLSSSFNVEISEGLDSLVGDPNDVEEEVVKKRKRAPAWKKKINGVIGGQGDNLILILMIIDKYVCFILCFFHSMFVLYFAHLILCCLHILLISFQY
jgi:hypothetical protein